MKVVCMATLQLIHIKSSIPKKERESTPKKRTEEREALFLVSVSCGAFSRKKYRLFFVHHFLLLDLYLRGFFSVARGYNLIEVMKKLTPKQYILPIHIKWLRFFLMFNFPFLY